MRRLQEMEAGGVTLVSSPAFISVGEFGMKESDSIPSYDVARRGASSSPSSVAVVLVPNTSAAVVATRVVGLRAIGRDGDLDALLLGFEDGLRERDVARDAVEQPLGILDRLPVRVLPEVARGQDVVIGVGRETVL